jgi:predicted transcriptional regulator of viral defense system
MARVLERLELDRAQLVTTATLAAMLVEAGIKTPARVVAARLREHGWLLPTDQRGVWEFAAADLAGPYSQGDPLVSVKSFRARRPETSCALTFQTAAWAHGLADRVPARLEVAVPAGAVARHLPRSLDGSVFVPVLPTTTVREVPVLAAESVLVHMAAKPSAVRSWASASEWLPDLAAELDGDLLVAELSERPPTVIARAGYLLQGLRPDLALRLRQAPLPAGKTWFGPRGKLLRHDARWQIADTLLPFDPRDLEDVR